MLIFFAVFLMAQDKGPEWLSGESKKYPKKDYFVGVGIGHGLDSAKADAAAAITKVFGATVQQTSVDVNTEKTTKKGSKLLRTSEVSTETETKVTSSEKIEGIEIAETWLNEKTKNYYALAVLNKTKMRQILSAQILDLEGDIHDQLEIGKKTSSNIEKVRSFSTALRFWDKKVELVNRKKIVDWTFIPDLISGDSKVKIRKMQDDAINRIVFVVDAARPGLNSVVSDRITKLGFKVIQSAPIQPDKTLTVITVKCSDEISPFDRGNPSWKFYNWKASAQMNQLWTSSGSFATISEEGESSHLSDATAKSKAYIDADRTLALSIEKRIRQNIFGE
ncbi:MAG: LPP20 family lipoprotein, partial [Elusimicrobia bacterium]|nr:LPP20 family lipoprotein [Elusimicrobiota bacterium]